MQNKIIGKVIIDGDCHGELVVSQQTFSFFGGFDFETGNIVDPKSDVFGLNLKNKIFAYPRGKGSSSTAGVILEALRQGVAPKAVINIESEKILAVGSIVAQAAFGWKLPLISISEEDFQSLSMGEYVKISNGHIESSTR